MKELLVDVIANYDLVTALIHFVIAVILFVIINWIGEKSVSVGYMQLDIVIKEDSAPAFNFLFKVIAPIVFLILCIVAFQSFNAERLVLHCYFIVFFYWLIRTIWILATSRRTLTNWSAQFLYWICSITLSLWIYSLVDKVDKILPNPRALLDQLWILIIIFLYSVFNKITLSRKGTILRKDNYIKARYTYFHKKYNDIVKGYFHNGFYETVTYAIMIYEDFNRPILVRWLEYVRFFLTKKPHSLGIMQVVSDKYIDDNTSLQLAMLKIVEDNNAIISAKEKGYYNNYANRLVYEIAEKYNGGDGKYASTISEMYEYIVKTFNKKIPSQFSEIKAKRGKKMVNYSCIGK